MVALVPALLLLLPPLLLLRLRLPPPPLSSAPLLSPPPPLPPPLLAASAALRSFFAFDPPPFAGGAAAALGLGCAGAGDTSAVGSGGGCQRLLWLAWTRTLCLSSGSSRVSTSGCECTVKRKRSADG